MGIMNVQSNQSDGRESVMCTGVRFSDDEGNTYFGRNLDWSFSYGETILVTPRGYHYDTVFGAGGKAKPNAVIGVGVVMADRPMYFDCANEHGLAIAGWNFPGYASFVHEPVEGTENVATFEFPLWVARNFDSVDEVEEALRNVTLVSQIVPGQQESLLHWFIGDGKRSIVVEQMADGMHVHHDDVDVLTNQPTFDFHMENLRNYMCVSSEMAEPTSWGKASLTAWGAGVGMHGIPGDVFPHRASFVWPTPTRITRSRTMQPPMCRACSTPSAPCRWWTAWRRWATASSNARCSPADIRPRPTPIT